MAMLGIAACPLNGPYSDWWAPERTSRQRKEGLLALAVARVVEHRCRWPHALEPPVVADIDPAPARVSLSLRQHRNGRIISMKPLGRHDVGFDQAQERIASVRITLQAFLDRKRQALHTPKGREVMVRSAIEWPN